MTVWSIPQIALIWIRNGGTAEGPALIQVCSVALAESGGNDKAIGPAGDYGLWQINRINFIHYGLNTTTALDRNRNARVAIAMSANAYNWAPWCTAWANPGANCGHGLLRQAQQGSAASRHFQQVIGELGAAGLLSGHLAGPQQTPHLSGVVGAWTNVQNYAAHGAPKQYADLANLNAALRRL